MKKLSKRQKAIREKVELEKMFQKAGFETRKAGQQVHVKTNIGGQSQQVDIMVVPQGETAQKFHVHDIPKGSPYKGLHKQIMIADLAKEKGACEYSSRTKYGQGILPIDTYKKDVDDIVPNNLKYDWDSLRSLVLEHGVRNSTLSAQMPSESSSIVSNATNGIEPPRDYLSIKKSKKGPLKQIVPSYQSLKNNYTLLWEMKSNKGYINIVAVMQKFFDQAISGNWSYNPEHYPNNEVPVSDMAQDLLTTYKYGWKTSYYQNTYDIKTDEVEETPALLDNLICDILDTSEEECESCKI